MSTEVNNTVEAIVKAQIELKALRVQCLINSVLVQLDEDYEGSGFGYEVMIDLGYTEPSGLIDLLGALKNEVGEVYHVSTESYTINLQYVYSYQD